MAGPAPKAGAQTLPLVTVAPKAASVTEGDVATFTLTAAPTPTAELNVHVVVTPVPRDFVGPPVLVGGQRGDRWVKFPANATTTDFTVATANDDIDEAGQQILVHAGRGEGDYRIEETNIIWLDILDNDDPAVSFDSATYDVDEGDAVTLTLDVVLPQGTATTVNVACAAGTTSASEFSGCPSSVIVPANMGSHTFTVQTAEDAADEVAETFTVTLSLPDGTTGLRVHPHAAATVTVADDDRSGGELRLGDLRRGRGRRGDPDAERGAAARHGHDGQRRLRGGHHLRLGVQRLPVQRHRPRQHGLPHLHGSDRGGRVGRGRPRRSPSRSPCPTARPACASTPMPRPR